MRRSLVCFLPLATQIRNVFICLQLHTQPTFRLRTESTDQSATYPQTIDH